MKINILLPNNFVKYHTSYAFTYPIIKSFNLIKKEGININFLHSIKKKNFECDILIIESRFYNTIKEKSHFLNYLKKININKIIFADTNDSTGQIQNEILTLVNSYWKTQILKNKKEYTKSHYGGRLFTNFYNKKFNIKDNNEQFSEPINIKLLKKIKICWNAGLCDYGKYAYIKQKLFSIFKSKFLINNSNYSSYSFEKNINISCRIETNYDRETVKFQRDQIAKVLKRNNIETKKISRSKYLKEIKNSKFVISPFGWGEICPRDFEIFINGGILMKPNMDNIDTWPNWYISNKTYIPINWDLIDFEKKIETSLNNYEKLKRIAISAQKNYFFYTTHNSKKIFAERFLKLIKN